MRLIDADALIEDIKSFWDWDSIDGITSTTVLKQTITDISHAPTIDAVPVVRCENCKFGDWYDSASGECLCYCTEHGSSGHNENDYCSYGEREDDE